MDNCTLSTKKLLNLLKVEHTNNYLKDAILSHPDHPSLLTVSDTLDKYNIEKLAVKIEAENFDISMEAGIILRDLGYNEKAIEHFEEALNVIEPSEALNSTSDVKFSKPEPKGAVKLAETVDELVNLLHNDAKVI